VAAVVLIHFGLNFPQNPYRELGNTFLDIYNRAREQPIDPISPVLPEWVSLLRKECENPLWSLTLGDLVLHAYPKAATYIQEQYAQLILATERQEIKLSDHLSPNYQHLNTRSADLEALVSGMNAKSNVVFVGSGPQPNSVMAYAGHAGKVTGIDCDPEAIMQSRLKIPKPLKSKILLETGYGETFNYRGYSHIVLAAMVPDKQAVLRRIRNTADPNAWVILRDTRGLKGALYPPSQIDTIPGFDKIAEIHGNAQNITHAIIFRKKRFIMSG